MPSIANPPSFGSHAYWDQRFTTHPAPFDWLSAPSALDPAITAALAAHAPTPQVLHIGCGSSALSQHLKALVGTARQVHNVDYSRVVVDAERARELAAVDGSADQCARWDAVDLLDPVALLGVCGRAAYSVVVDKSTSDAIACAEDVVCSLPYVVSTQTPSSDVVLDVKLEREVPVHPLHLMAVHLALVAKPGAQWIALSYSAERFPFLDGGGSSCPGFPDPALLWTVVDRRRMEAAEEVAHDTTHRPKVYHWVYVLQRTATPVSLQHPEHPELSQVGQPRDIP